MSKVDVFSDEHKAIDDKWSEFFLEYREEFPTHATSLTIGAIILTFLEMYEPPVEEVGPIMMAALVKYAEQQDREHKGYLN